MDNNKNIAKNTLFLYFRMLLIMLVSLYTSRVILKTLGVEDFGLYNIIGGIIILFSFFNSAVTSATQRFLSFELGRKKLDSFQKIINLSLLTYIALSLIIIFLSETIGLWFLNNKMTIPDNKLYEANWVFQLSILTFILGLLAARWILYRKSDATRIFWDGIFTMPLVLPPTVAGFFLLVFFGSYGPVGKLFENYLGIKIAFSWGATILAAVVMSFPLMYRSARGALEQIDEDLIFAARTLGMSEWSIFFRVMIPNALPGIISGGVLAFARGLGEFGATAMIAGNIPGRTRTLPLAVYSEVAAGNMDAAYQYVLVIVIICFAIVAAMNIYLIMEKKKQEA